MIDYSEILLNIQKLHRDCHEALLKQNWKLARRIAHEIHSEVEDLEDICRNKEGEGK